MGGGVLVLHRVHPPVRHPNVPLPPGLLHGQHPSALLRQLGAGLQKTRHCLGGGSEGKNRINHCSERDFHIFSFGVRYDVGKEKSREEKK